MKACVIPVLFTAAPAASVDAVRASDQAHWDCQKARQALAALADGGYAGLLVFDLGSR